MIFLRRHWNCNESTRALLALLHLLPPTAGGRFNKTNRETAVSAVDHLIVFQNVR